MIHAKIISFTRSGASVGKKIIANMPNDLVEEYARALDSSIKQTSLKRMVQQAMVDCDLIIFIGATGIAVRMCAPFLQGKQFDPAVLVIDDRGQFVISLLSGHLGGANEYAKQIAKLLNAQPVITTATDNHHIFSVDSWAKSQNFQIANIKEVQWISSALLEGKNVTLQSEFPICEPLPTGITLDFQPEYGIQVSIFQEQNTFFHTVQLIPSIVHIGIGCRKGTSEQTIAQTVQEILQEYQIQSQAIQQVASIDIKKNEFGLCSFCNNRNLPFVTYTAQQLTNIEGDFSHSDFVKTVTGVDTVCERAAILSSGGGRLLCKKTIRNGITMALAVENWRITF